VGRRSVCHGPPGSFVSSVLNALFYRRMSARQSIGQWCRPGTVWGDNCVSGAVCVNGFCVSKTVPPANRVNVSSRMRHAEHERIMANSALAHKEYEEREKESRAYYSTPEGATERAAANAEDAISRAERAERANAANSASLRSAAERATAYAAQRATARANGANSALSPDAAPRATVSTKRANGASSTLSSDTARRAAAFAERAAAYAALAKQRPGFAEPFSVAPAASVASTPRPTLAPPRKNRTLRTSAKRRSGSSNSSNSSSSRRRKSRR
jgi:hypothetical protein